MSDYYKLFDYCKKTSEKNNLRKERYIKNKQAKEKKELFSKITNSAYNIIKNSVNDGFDYAIVYEDVYNNLIYELMDALVNHFKPFNVLYKKKNYNDRNLFEVLKDECNYILIIDWSNSNNIETNNIETNNIETNNIETNNIETNITDTELKLFHNTSVNDIKIFKPKSVCLDAETNTETETNNAETNTETETNNTETNTETDSKNLSMKEVFMINEANRVFNEYDINSKLNNSQIENEFESLNWI